MNDCYHSIKPAYLELFLQARYVSIMNKDKLETEFVNGHWLPRIIILVILLLLAMSFINPQVYFENIIGNFLGINERTEEVIVTRTLILLSLIMSTVVCVGIYIVKHSVGILKHNRLPPPNMLQPFKVRIYRGIHARLTGILFLVLGGVIFCGSLTIIVWIWTWNI